MYNEDDLGNQWIASIGQGMQRPQPSASELAGANLVKSTQGLVSSAFEPRSGMKHAEGRSMGLVEGLTGSNDANGLRAMVDSYTQRAKQGRAGMDGEHRAGLENLNKFMDILGRAKVPDIEAFASAQNTVNNIQKFEEMQELMSQARIKKAIETTMLGGDSSGLGDEGKLVYLASRGVKTYGTKGEDDSFVSWDTVARDRKQVRDTYAEEATRRLLGEASARNAKMEFAVKNIENQMKMEQAKADAYSTSMNANARLADQNAQTAAMERRAMFDIVNGKSNRQRQIETGLAQTQGQADLAAAQAAGIGREADIKEIAALGKLTDRKNQLAKSKEIKEVVPSRIKALMATGGGGELVPPSAWQNRNFGGAAGAQPAAEPAIQLNEAQANTVKKLLSIKDKSQQDAAFAALSEKTGIAPERLKAAVNAK